MKFWIVVLKGFGHVWITLGAIAIVIGMAGVWIYDGFFAMLHLMSPFNVLNWLAMLITLAPGAAALVWADKLKEKQSGLRSRQSKTGG